MNNNNAFYGWKLVAVFFVIYFMNTIPYYGSSVIAPYMAPAIGLERSQLGLGFTFFILIIGLAAPLIGKLVINHGVRLVVTVGSLGLSIATCLIGLFANSAWHFIILFGIVGGISFGLGGLLPIQSGVMYWFNKRKALALSIVIASTGIATLLAVPLINWLIQNNDGNWRLGWFLMSAGCAIATVFAALGIRNKPEDLGQHIDGITPDATASHAEGDSEAAQYQWTAAEAIKTSSFWLVVLGGIGYLATSMVCIAHGVIHLREIGHSSENAAAALGLTVALSIVGRLGAGFLSDRYSPKLVMIGALILCTLGVIFINLSMNSWQIYAYAAAMGIGLGASLVSQPTLITSFFGNQYFPQIFGVSALVATLIGASAPTIVGYVYDVQGTYGNALNVLAVLGAVAVLLVCFAQKPVPKSESL